MTDTNPDQPYPWATQEEAENLPDDRRDRVPPSALMLGDWAHVPRVDGFLERGTVTGLIQTATSEVLVFLNGAGPDDGIPVKPADDVTIVRPAANGARPVNWNAQRAALLAAVDHHVAQLQHAASDVTAANHGLTSALELITDAVDEEFRDEATQPVPAPVGLKPAGEQIADALEQDGWISPILPEEVGEDDAGTSEPDEDK